MSTRQVRLSTIEQIKTRLHQYSGRKINIVLNNKSVLFGQLTSIDNANLHFVNMRLKKISLPLDTVSEVYLDFKE